MSEADGRLLAVGGPLHGRVVTSTTAVSAGSRVVVTDHPAQSLLISGDPVSAEVAVFGKVWVYDRVRVDGLLVWSCGSSARSKETAVDALAIAAGLKTTEMPS